VVTDKELQERLLGRDDGALREIYDRFGGLLLAIALRVTKDRVAAENVTQDVVIALWDHPEKYRPELGPLGPWLARMARYRSVDWVRQETAARRRELRLAQGNALHLPSTEETVVKMMVAEQARMALVALSDQERTPIAMAFFGYMTYRQIAEELAIPEGTIKSRIRSGLRHMAVSAMRGVEGAEVSVSAGMPSRPMLVP
jgi:RNA polymerase sigma factor (sigma-70 family)